MSSYVFTPVYVGLDRRISARPRLVERRKLDADVLAPSLETALRQLVARAIELDSERTGPAFIERLKATRELAEKRRQRTVAERLGALIEALADHGAGKSDLAASYLAQASCALAP